MIVDHMWREAEAGYAETLLRDLGEAIASAEKRFDGLPEDDESGWVDSLIDEFSEFSDGMLGAAFVICQTVVTKMVSRSLHLSRMAERSKRAAFTKNSRGDLLDLGPILGGGLTAGRAIDGAANYWKHRDEWWSFDWSRLTGQSAKTAAVVAKMGLTAGSTGNMRTAFNYFGKMMSYGDFTAVLASLRAWAREVCRVAEQELSDRQLV
jgi:hypothetical protein